MLHLVTHSHRHGISHYFIDSAADLGEGPCPEPVQRFLESTQSLDFEPDREEENLEILAIKPGEILVFPQTSPGSEEGVKTALASATIEELTAELHRREGVAISVWSVEDVISMFEEDKRFASLSDADRELAADFFVKHAGRGLTEVLGERGNNYLGDRFEQDAAFILENYKK